MIAATELNHGGGSVSKVGIKDFVVATFDWDRYSASSIEIGGGFLEVVGIAPIYLVDRGVVGAFKFHRGSKHGEVFNADARSRPEIKGIVSALHLDFRCACPTGINSSRRHDC